MRGIRSLRDLIGIMIPLLSTLVLAPFHILVDKGEASLFRVHWSYLVRYCHHGEVKGSSASMRE